MQTERESKKENLCKFTETIIHPHARYLFPDTGTDRRYAHRPSACIECIQFGAQPAKLQRAIGLLVEETTNRCTAGYTSARLLLMEARHGAFTAVFL